MSNYTGIEAVYRQYADALYRIALSHLQNPDDAQDALQDVFEKYITLPVKPLSENHTKAWLIRATINCCHDKHRRDKYRRSEDFEKALLVADLSADSEGLVSLMQKLDTLQSKLLDVVILHCLEGFTLEETAKLLRISLSAAKMRLQRAREQLRALNKEEDHV